MRAVVGVVALALVLTACGRDTPTVPSPSVVTGASAGSVAVSTAPSTTVPTPAVPAGYVGSLVRTTGSDGAVTYDAQVPRLSGGTPAVTQRFNESMRASLADQVREPPGIDGTMTVKPGRLANDEQSRVTQIGPGVVAGLLLTNAYIQGGAHGSTLIGTVVIRASDARPVLLRDLFTSPATGLAALAARVKARTTEPAGETVFVQDPARDMANWLPSPAGLTVYGAVSHAAGDWLPITVPWSELKGVIAPAMWPVVTS